MQPGIIGRIGRFELLKLVGQGGMGVVYLARDPQHPDPLALKVLRPELAQNPRSLAFFLKEARHGSKLDHPHILPVREFSKEPAYLIMPYLERGCLSAWLKTKPQLTESVIANLARQIALAMTFAHRKGLIHRDLKPSNILLDADGRAYVSDFGLSLSLFNDSLIDPGSSSVEGTPNYMSPAMAAGEVEDTRCDIYSFGTVLYELLAGQPPYAGLQAREVLAKIREGPPRPILELNPAASPVLARIAEKAMARRLSDRYAHMEYVAADLESVMTGKPIALDAAAADRTLAPIPATLPEAKSRWTHGITKRPGISIALGIMILALVLALALSATRSPLRVVGMVQVPGIIIWLNAHLGDGDTKPPPEILAPRDNNLAVVGLSGEVLHEFKPPISGGETMEFQGQVDLNNDNRLERLVSWRAESNVYLSIYNDNDYEIKRLTISGSVFNTATGPRPGSGIWQCSFADFDQDGQLEILAQIVTGMAKSPQRALVVLDSATGREKWRWDIAPNPHSLTLADLESDGKTEVLLGSYATSNSVQLADGTDDNHCYLYCLDGNGSLRWRREIGDTYSSCYSAVIDSTNDGGKEVLAFRKTAWEHRHDGVFKPYPQLFLLDKDGHVLRQFGGTNINSPSWLVADLNGDQKTDIFLTDCDGNLYWLEPDLRLRQQTHLVPNLFTWVRLELWGAEDLDGDGRKELVLSSARVEFIAGENPGRLEGEVSVRRFHDNEILVLDSSLNILARRTIATTWERISNIQVELADLAGDGRKEIVVFADKTYWLQYRGRSRWL